MEVEKKGQEDQEGQEKAGASAPEEEVSWLDVSYGNRARDACTPSRKGFHKLSFVNMHLQIQIWLEVRWM